MVRERLESTVSRILNSAYFSCKIISPRYQEDVKNTSSTKNLEPCVHFNMAHYSVVELCKDDMTFSVAHFTIFSATDRENLHGHNYTVSAALFTEVSEQGLSFDYRKYKHILRKLCNTLNQTTLIPTQSPYVVIETDDQYHTVHYAEETLYFLKRDTLLLPIRNITVEELSRFLVEALTKDLATLATDHILGITVKVFSAPGQSGSFTWGKMAW